MIVVAAAQPKYDPVWLRDDYLHKSKSLKSTGYVLVTVGVAASVVGLVMSNAAGTGDDQFGLNTLEKLPGQMLVIAGVTTALCSIPFFIKAGKYDRKAAAISLGNRKMISPFQPGFIPKSQPAITLNIKF